MPDLSRFNIPPVPENLPGKLIYRVVSGSHAYGTSTPESDLDLRGVFLPDQEYVFGFLHHVEQVERKKTKVKDEEETLFEFRKFMHLASQANPNILELLFVPDDCVVEIDAEGKILRRHRHLFLSKKVLYTFTGYAHSQLHRIRTHRKWLFNPPKKKPEREDFGLPSETLVSREQRGAFYVLLAHLLRDNPETEDLFHAVEDVIEAEEFPGWEGIVQKRGIPDAAMPYAQLLTGASDNFIAALQREQAYHRAVDEWSKYQDWKKKRNPARAELERKFGLDTKHASHLVRLMWMGEEILRTGTLTVRRPDAERLLAIRNGTWIDGTPVCPDTFDVIEQWAKDQETKMREVYDSKTCELPKKPRMNEINDLCISILRNHFGLPLSEAQLEWFVTERGYK